MYTFLFTHLRSSLIQKTIYFIDQIVIQAGLIIVIQLWTSFNKIVLKIKFLIFNNTKDAVVALLRGHIILISVENQRETSLATKFRQANQTTNFMKAFWTP